MPEVFQARFGEYNLDQMFKLTSKRIEFASCFIVSSFLRVDGTTIVCRIIKDMSGYETLSGDLNIVLMFNGGVKKSDLALARKWKVGSNEVTFNEVITGNLQLTSQGNCDNDLELYVVHNRLLLTNSFSKIMCIGGIESGVLNYKIESQGANFFSQFEMLIVTSVNAFGQPLFNIDLSSLQQKISSDSKTLTVSFGAIPEGKRLYFSALVFFTTSEFIIDYQLNLKCLFGALKKRERVKYKIIGNFDSVIPNTSTISFNSSAAPTTTKFIRAVA